MNRKVFSLILAALVFIPLSCAFSPTIKTHPDAPFLPTPDSTVKAMLSLAELTEKDTVYDLGCGDGRIVIRAALYSGAKGVGIEIDPKLIAKSTERARAAGVGDKITFLQADLFAVNLKGATVVTLYLLPGVNVMLRPKLLSELEPGSRVVSHMHDMGDWKPDRTVRIGDSTVYLWVIPADIEGYWDLTIPTAPDPVHSRLFLRQTFQDISGVLALPAKRSRIREGRLHGRSVEFSADGLSRKKQTACFTGTVHGDTMEGDVILSTGSADETYRWMARRQQPR